MASVAIPTGAMEEILSNPADDAPRMMLADYLEERDDPRGEFIRVQCRIAECCAWHRAGNPTHPDFDWLLQREGELHQIGQVPHYKWLSSLGIDPSYCVFNRGFVAGITCTAANFLKHANALYWHPDQKRPRPDGAQPLEEVTLTTFARPEQLRQREWKSVDNLAGLRRQLDEVFGAEWPRLKFKLRRDEDMSELNALLERIASQVATVLPGVPVETFEPSNWTPLARANFRYQTGMPLRISTGALINSIH